MSQPCSDIWSSNLPGQLLGFTWSTARQCGHSRSTEPEQHPVNPLNSAFSTATATYHQHHPVASCKPRTGARLPERYKETHEGAAVFYQRNDGQSGKHWRNLDMRRNPGVTGDGWQVRRFDPVDPSSATALCLTEGEKDAAHLSAAGLIAFTAPRGAQSLPGADFTELVALAKDTHLPILLIGDNDEVGRKAMRQVRRQLQPVGVPEPLPYPITGWKRTQNPPHLDVTDLTGRAPEKGSIADLPQPELHKLLGLLLQDLDERMVKPVRSRMMYREYWCPHPKRQQRAAGDDQNIMTFLPCGNTATCQKCCDWENFLHIERCWRGEPAQMVVVSGFGGADSTIAETVGMAKVYRGRWKDRLRKTSAVDKYQENPTSTQSTRFW